MADTPDNPDDVSMYTQAREAADALARATPTIPRVVIVLGSGLGAFADAVQDSVTIPFAAIPHVLPTTVAGHAGQLVIGAFAGVSVAVMRGRLHLYEGYTPQQITFPLRVLRLLGVETCILTNAAGGVNTALSVGSLLLIRDHIGFPSLAGLHPLFGSNDERFGPRFHAMAEAYDLELRHLTTASARRHSIDLAEGVYVMVGGPSFETQAELRMLRVMGADAVGMSTVPEAIVARHMGMRVLALSLITNQAFPDAEAPEIPDHEQVLRIAAEATGRLTTLLGDVIAQMA